MKKSVGKEIPDVTQALTPGTNLVPTEGVEQSFQDMSHLLPEPARKQGFTLRHTPDGAGGGSIHFHGPKGQWLARVAYQGVGSGKADWTFHVGDQVTKQPQVRTPVVNHLSRALREVFVARPQPFKGLLDEANQQLGKAEGGGKKGGGSWQGRHIVNPEHASILETESALLEFRDRKPRHVAEEEAHQSYRRGHHVDAAAHHLRGMKVAQLAGHTEEAHKHAAMYALHLQQLGHSEYKEPPAEVRSKVDRPPEGGKKLYSFKGHDADNLLLKKSDPTINAVYVLKKAWPKDDAENQANAAAHQVMEDAILEQGGAKEEQTYSWGPPQDGGRKLWAHGPLPVQQRNQSHLNRHALISQAVESPSRFTPKHSHDVGEQIGSESPDLRSRENYIGSDSSTRMPTPTGNGLPLYNPAWRTPEGYIGPDSVVYTDSQHPSDYEDTREGFTIEDVDRRHVDAHSRAQEILAPPPRAKNVGVPAPDMEAWKRFARLFGGEKKMKKSDDGTGVVAAPKPPPLTDTRISPTQIRGIQAPGAPATGPIRGMPRITPQQPQPGGLVPPPGRTPMVSNKPHPLDLGPGMGDPRQPSAPEIAPVTHQELASRNPNLWTLFRKSALRESTIKKGWPKDDAENQANAAAHQVMEDAILERGGKQTLHETPGGATYVPISGRLARSPISPDSQRGYSAAIADNDVRQRELSWQDDPVPPFDAQPGVSGYATRKPDIADHLGAISPYWDPQVDVERTKRFWQRLSALSGLPIKKAWPKDEQENVENQAGFLNNPASQDLAMESGFGAPVVHDPKEVANRVRLADNRVGNRHNDGRDIRTPEELASDVRRTAALTANRDQDLTPDDQMRPEDNIRWHRAPVPPKVETSFWTIIGRAAGIRKRELSKAWPQPISREDRGGTNPMNDPQAATTHQVLQDSIAERPDVQEVRPKSTTARVQQEFRNEGHTAAYDVGTFGGQWPLDRNPNRGEILDVGENPSEYRAAATHAQSDVQPVLDRMEDFAQVVAPEYDAEGLSSSVGLDSRLAEAWGGTVDEPEGLKRPRLVNTGHQAYTEGADNAAQEHAFWSSLRREIGKVRPRKMKKGWPKNEKENQANAAGFVRESPPTEDRLMEQLPTKTEPPPREFYSASNSTLGIGKWDAVEDNDVKNSTPTIRQAANTLHLRQQWDGYGGRGFSAPGESGDSHWARWGDSRENNFWKWIGGLSGLNAEKQRIVNGKSAVKVQKLPTDIAANMDATAIKKGWPKNEGENEENAKGFLNQQAAQDHYMEQGGTAPEVESEPNPLFNLPGKSSSGMLVAWKRNAIPMEQRYPYEPFVSNQNKNLKEYGTYGWEDGAQGPSSHLSDDPNEGTQKDIAGERGFWRLIGRAAGIQKRELVKSFQPPGPPAAPKQQAQPQLHQDVNSFMTGLKGLPKEGAERGKFITAHLNHPPFIAALQQHPQGKQLHQQLLTFANSRANAGFRPGQTQAVAKNFGRLLSHWATLSKADSGKVLSFPDRKGQIRDERRRQMDATFQSALETMSSDPGFQELAEQKHREAKEAELKSGPAKFRPGDRVVHATNPESYPWVGVVGPHNPPEDDEEPHRLGPSYREFDIDGPGHYFNVKWWNPKARQYHEDWLHQDHLAPAPRPGLRKGWPRSEAQNRDNQSGFVRESPPTEDALMEQLPVKSSTDTRDYASVSPYLGLDVAARRRMFEANDANRQTAERETREAQSSPTDTFWANQHGRAHGPSWGSEYPGETALNGAENDFWQMIARRSGFASTRRGVTNGKSAVKVQKIPADIAANMDASIKKGWPKDERENQANAAANQVAQDSLLQAGMDRQEMDHSQSLATPPTPMAQQVKNARAWSNGTRQTAFRNGVESTAHEGTGTTPDEVARIDRLHALTRDSASVPSLDEAGGPEYIAHADNAEGEAMNANINTDMRQKWPVDMVHEPSPFKPLEPATEWPADAESPSGRAREIQFWRMLSRHAGLEKSGRH